MPGAGRFGIVGGAAVPHAPQFFTLPDTEDHDQVERVRVAMARVGANGTPRRGRGPARSRTPSEP